MDLVELIKRLRWLWLNDACFFNAHQMLIQHQMYATPWIFGRDNMRQR